MLLSKHHPEPRVLLIEDTEDTRELSRMALESQACEVVAVSSAEAALGLLQAGERFDLVFTDVCLGAVSGIEAAHRVKQEQPGLPVLVTSGLAHLPPIKVVQLSRMVTAKDAAEARAGSGCSRSRSPRRSKWHAAIQSEVR